MSTSSTSFLNVVVAGCIHGKLDEMYASVFRIEANTGKKVDLILCCGDFQSTRHEKDLSGMNCPQKYRFLESFPDYYSGRKVAPILTIFIGGNHEASHFLQQLYYGGWVAPNIYFLGFSGVINFGGIRIAGVSGIYNRHHYNFGYYEMYPYDQESIRSVYHYREFEFFKLSQLTGHVDIVLSHDWPHKITDYGDRERLGRLKPFFREELDTGTFGGSPPSMELLKRLKPDFWFSAHMHVKFSAVVPHSEGATNFLALDKCLPRRQFLQLFQISRPSGSSEVPALCYDAEWLAIIRSTHTLMSRVNGIVRLPSQYRKINEEDIRWIEERFHHISLDFSVSSQGQSDSRNRGNIQTDHLLSTLELDHIITFPECIQSVASETNETGDNSQLNDRKYVDPNEIQFDD